MPAKACPWRRAERGQLAWTRTALLHIPWPRFARCWRGAPAGHRLSESDGRSWANSRKGRLPFCGTPASARRLEGLAGKAVWTCSSSGFRKKRGRDVSAHINCDSHSLAHSALVLVPFYLLRRPASLNLTPAWSCDHFPVLRVSSHGKVGGCSSVCDFRVLFQ